MSGIFEAPSDVLSVLDFARRELLWHDPIEFVDILWLQIQIEEIEELELLLGDKPEIFDRWRLTIVCRDFATFLHS